MPRQGSIFLRFLLVVCCLHVAAQPQKIWSSSAQIAGNIYTFAGNASGYCSPANFPKAGERASGGPYYSCFLGFDPLGSTAVLGDGGSAQSNSVYFQNPSSVAVDSNGNVYMADAYNRIRVANRKNGIISNYAGLINSAQTMPLGDGGPATSALLNGYGYTISSMIFDTSNNMYLVDGSNRVRFINAATGIITTVAGTGSLCCLDAATGDGKNYTLHPTIVLLLHIILY